MKRIRNIFQRLVIGGGIASTIGAAVVVWMRWPTAERVAIGQYAAATCISPEPIARRRVWKNTIPLGAGQSVRLDSTGEMRSMFELAFSDENRPRQVTTFWDYSYPSDARINPSTNTLWLVVSGGVGSLFDRAKLYQYDLGTRTIAHEFALDPGDLPAACVASANPGP
jgi:hypothetical protein